MEKSLTIRYHEYACDTELTPDDKQLLEKAKDATNGTYSPYSHFSVGAAVRMADGSIALGSNQENVAYPSGLCAERTAIFAASAAHPQMREFKAIAIVGRNSNGEWCEASPCGACRQVLQEYEQLQKHPLRVVCAMPNGRVRAFESVADLLPFSFSL
ncbi:MAG: cytidine deaminase [Bacteroidales bacterium]|nr:cytidine deaminase [Bacteroidales bacterium]